MHESPDGDKDKDFMAFLNPNSLTVKTAYLEPSLSNAEIGDRFQFQRLGYFVVDKDSKPNQLVFNKTVGLRDSWSKHTQNDQSGNKSKRQSDTQTHQKQTQKRSAISLIQQLGKKYTNLPEDKQAKAKTEIQTLARDISYDELEPLFGTAVKKVGTRIATMIALKALLENGLERNKTIDEFITKAQEDKNELLFAEASGL